MSTTEVENDLTSAQRRSNQIKLLILWLVPIGLMGIAGIAYYLVQTGQLELGSNNKGDLIRPPIQLSETFEATGNQELADVWNGNWTMLVRTSGTCEEACKEALYISRQLHISLNQRADRVQRVMLIDNFNGDPALLEFIDKEHHLLKLFVTDGAALSELDNAVAKTILETRTIPKSGEQAVVQFMIVDPNGWAMMAYHQGHEGKNILADLKHLLRYSRDG